MFLRPGANVKPHQSSVKIIQFGTCFFLYVYKKNTPNSTYQRMSSPSVSLLRSRLVTGFVFVIYNLQANY